MNVKSCFSAATMRRRQRPDRGIPRALLLYDYAPMLIGFLNSLGVKVLLSSKTTGR